MITSPFTTMDIISAEGTGNKEGKKLTKAFSEIVKVSSVFWISFKWCFLASFVYYYHIIVVARLRAVNQSPLWQIESRDYSQCLALDNSHSSFFIFSVGISAKLPWTRHGLTKLTIDKVNLTKTLIKPQCWCMSGSPCPIAAGGTVKSRRQPQHDKIVREICQTFIEYLWYCSDDFFIRYKNKTENKRKKLRQTLLTAQDFWRQAYCITQNQVSG